MWRMRPGLSGGRWKTCPWKGKGVGHAYLLSIPGLQQMLFI